jgi:hypothetical protein
MAMWVSCDSGLSEIETSRKIKELEDKHPEIMQYFWVSKPKPCDSYAMEDALKIGLKAQYSFIVQRNNTEGPDLLRVIPKLLYEVFGTEVILPIDMDGEVITSEDADLIAAKGFSPYRAPYK